MRSTEQCNVCQVLTGIKQINMLKTRIYAIINSPLHIMFTNALKYEFKSSVNREKYEKFHNEN